MDRQATVEALQQSKLFARLTPEKLAKVADRGQIRELSSGELLVRELQANTELFVILAGRFEVFLPLTPERFSKLQIGKLDAGDCIGEYSFIDKQPASASVVARGQSIVFAIGHEDFEKLLQSDSIVGRAVFENLLRVLIERLRQEIQSLDLFHPSA